ncbi:MAG: hypothetical protein ACE10G_05045 [Gemmatimonadales bacterium]
MFGCITEQSGLLFIEFDTSPYQNPVSADTVQLVGRVVRAPPKRDVITTVTVTSGGVSVVDTTNAFGVFRTDFPLQRDTENLLLLTAADESGARQGELRLTIVHQSATQASGALDARLSRTTYVDLARLMVDPDSVVPRILNPPSEGPLFALVQGRARHF